MKVVILDFDGVIVTPRTRFRSPDPTTIPHLKKILEETDAKIVISSAWRITRSLKELRDILWLAGIEKELVIDVTPRTVNLGGLRVDCGGNRGQEIQAWLDLHPEVEAFVILDDDTFDLQDHGEKVVETEMEEGLTIHNANKAIAILNGEA